MLGTVQDFYLDRQMQQLTAIYLGLEGLLSREESLILWADVVIFGQDAILVKDAQSVRELSEVEDASSLIRRAEVNGRPVDTPGGTKIGLIGDIILDEQAMLAGFTFDRVYVSGPIAESRAISRSAVMDIGEEDSVMITNLGDAEHAKLQVAYAGLFAEPSVSSSE